MEASCRILRLPIDHENFFCKSLPSSEIPERVGSRMGSIGGNPMRPSRVIHAGPDAKACHFFAFWGGEERLAPGRQQGALGNSYALLSCPPSGSPRKEPLKEPVV